MKKLVLTCLTFSLLGLSVISFAGRGGSLSIINSTGYTIHKVSTTGDSSMNRWKLPDKIDPQDVKTSYVEFKYQRKWYLLWTPIIWINRGHAETIYAAYCPNGRADLVRIISKVINNRPTLNAKLLSNDCVRIKPANGVIGWNHNGTVALTIENKSGIHLPFPSNF